MPASLIAAAILLTLLVPGYLFQMGVADYINVLPAARDVQAIAQAVAISAGLLLTVFVLVKLFGTASLMNDLLHNPGSKAAKGLTTAQTVLLVALLTLSHLLGRLVGRVLRFFRQRSLRGDAPLGGPTKGVGWLWRLFFEPSPLVKQIDQIVRSAAAADAQPVYVRLVRQGEDDIIGLIDAQAEEASQSTLGAGLALSSRWEYDLEHGGWSRLGGTHVPRTGLVAVFEWREHGAPVPSWVEAIQR